MVLAHAAALAVPHEEGGTRLERVLEGRWPHSWFLFFWKDTAFKDDTLELPMGSWAKGPFWPSGTECWDPCAAGKKFSEA
jgi:hypothetical protein